MGAEAVRCPQCGAKAGEQCWRTDVMSRYPRPAPRLDEPHMARRVASLEARVASLEAREVQGG